MARCVPLLALLLVACDEGPRDTDPTCPRPWPAPGDPAPRVAVAAEPEVAALAASVGDLAGDVLGRVDPSLPNTAFSSLSALGMFSVLLPGADAATADALTALLRVDQPVDDHHAALGALLGDLDDTDRGWGFSWGAGFWHRPELAVQPAWADRVGALYGVTPTPLDFVGDPEGTRETLNAWVDDRTRCLVPEFYPPGYPIDRILHVAIHAMALEARWASPFEASFTWDRAFHRADGSTVDVPTMESESFVGSSGRDGDRTVLRLPYVGDDLAMYVVMPDEPTDPSTLAVGLDAATLDAWAAVPPREGGLSLRLPKWSTTAAHDLVELLPDYEPLIGAPMPAICADCAMPDVLRQVVVVLVDEEGTRAAAVTSGETNDSEPEWTDVDRPFLWFLRDDVSGTVLWLGWVGDPSSG